VVVLGPNLAPNSGVYLGAVSDACAFPPDTFRAALNKYTYPAIAPTFELWCEGIYAGLFSPLDCVTIARLLLVAQELGRATSADTIKEGLKQGVGHFWGVVHIEDDEGTLPPCKTPRNTTRTGRTPTSYRLLPYHVQKQALLALAAPRILEEHFPVEKGCLAPIKAAFLEVLGFDRD
jgi:hypothetical protein